MISHDHPLALACFIFVLGVASWCSPAPSNADAWTDDEVAIARLVVSEASFGTSDDARVITWIVAHNAKRRGVSPAEYVATVHHRHVRSSKRPWLAGLDASMAEPSGWPATVSWADRGAPGWSARLSEVRRALAEDDHGCDAAPVTWGGPSVDRERLEYLATRGYVPRRCGLTRNVFVGRSDR